MSSVTFSGLASGMDTDSIIEALMEIEREPVESLENDIEYYEAETAAYAELNELMEDLLDAVEGMDTVNELSTRSASSSDEGLLQATATSSAAEGTYHIEIVSLAETQKDVSAEGFADSDSTTLSGSLTIGETTIDYADVTLEELAGMINEADTGLQASILNDGTENGYRLRLSGKEAGVSTEISGTGSIAMDTATDGHTYSASQAHIVIDNVDIYSTSNTITDVIPGVTLDLIDADSESSLTLNVATDTDAIEDTISSFVTAYNAIIDWTEEQSDSDWGSDSNIRSVKQKMQSFLTTWIEGSGSYSSLIDLGIETDYQTGRISLDSDSLNEALDTDLESVLALFAGSNSSDGVADIMADYFDVQTDRFDGIYARRSASNDATVERLNDRIDRLEARLEKREEYLRAQYTAMEEMVSELNSQLSYLEALSS